MKRFGLGYWLILKALLIGTIILLAALYGIRL
jgi:hypothetical protein